MLHHVSASFYLYIVKLYPQRQITEMSPYTGRGQHRN